MNYKMKVGIVYTSVTGNTESLANILAEEFRKQRFETFLYSVENFSMEWLEKFDVFVIGTYTWGKGAVPESMKPLFKALEDLAHAHLVTGVFGTGDSFFPQYCGAVDRFRDLLKERTRLAVTLKVELFPQKEDRKKCKLFVEKCEHKLNGTEGQVPCPSRF